MTAQLLGFVAACLAIIVVPGPDTALLLRNATADRRTVTATATATGIMTGNTLLAIAAVAGLTALFQSSQVLYDAVRLVGAGYLIHLGVQSLRTLRRRTDRPQGVDDDSRQPQSAPASGVRVRRRAFRQGMLSNLLNPKVATFYIALFPQFSLPGMSTFLQQSILAAVFCALALVWYVLLAALLGRVQALLAWRRVQHGITGVSGAALVGLGTGLALQGRPGVGPIGA